MGLPFTVAESEVQRGGLGQQAGDPQNQGVNPDLPDANASVQAGGKADAWVPRGGVATRYPEKPGLGPIPGLAELMTSMTSASSRQENCRAPADPAFQSCAFRKGKERGDDDSGNPQSEFNEKLVMMVIKN